MARQLTLERITVVRLPALVGLAPVRNWGHRLRPGALAVDCRRSRAANHVALFADLAAASANELHMQRLRLVEVSGTPVVDRAALDRGPGRDMPLVVDLAGIRCTAVAAEPRVALRLACGSSVRTLALGAVAQQRRIIRAPSQLAVHGLAACGLPRVAAALAICAHIRAGALVSLVALVAPRRARGAKLTVAAAPKVRVVHRAGAARRDPAALFAPQLLALGHPCPLAEQCAALVQRVPAHALVAVLANGPADAVDGASTLVAKCRVQVPQRTVRIRAEVLDRIAAQVRTFFVQFV